jgi:hypothetical protein
MLLWSGQVCLLAACAVVLPGPMLSTQVKHNVCSRCLCYSCCCAAAGRCAAGRTCPVKASPVQSMYSLTRCASSWPAQQSNNRSAPVLGLHNRPSVQVRTLPAM